MSLLTQLLASLHRRIITPMRLRASKNRTNRRLEIGPAEQRLPGFETLSFVPSVNVDYVADAAERLPFPDKTFEMLYASHVLEHIPWFRTREVVVEWTRVLRPGGILELWVPNGYKLCELLCDIERGRERPEWQDGWRPAKSIRGPFDWINARLLYGARSDYPSWHQAILTPSSLETLFSEAGLVEIVILEPSQFRTVDHGWINLGIRGRRP